MTDYDGNHGEYDFEDIPPVSPTPQSVADMAKVSSVVEMLDFYGFDFTEEPGWETRQEHYQWESGGPFGVQVHHTVSVPYGARSAYPAPEGLRTDGRVIANALVQPDGTINLVAAGPANYSSGRGKRFVLDEYVRERVRFLGPQRENDDFPEWYGNRIYINIEVVHPGDGSAIPEVQEEALIGLVAILCFLFDWDSTAVIGHLDHTKRKIDPRFVGEYAGAPYSIAGIQNRVQELLDANDLNPGGDDDMNLITWAETLRDKDIDRLAEKGVISAGDAAYFKLLDKTSPEWRSLRNAVDVRNSIWNS